MWKFTVMTQGNTAILFLDSQLLQNTVHLFTQLSLLMFMETIITYFDQQNKKANVPNGPSFFLDKSTVEGIQREARAIRC
jgi:hypothetical protein